MRPSNWLFCVLKDLLFYTIIQACEVLESGETSTQDRACSTGTVTVRVDDLNDNIPSFNAQQYEVGIPEDISVDTPLPNLNLVVTDHDQVSSVFCIQQTFNVSHIFRELDLNLQPHN